MLKYFNSSTSRIFSDDETIQGIKKGGFISNRYIDNLYQCYLPLIINLVKANQGTEEEAKDVFQNGLIKFYKYVVNGKFRQECSIKTYLYTICRGLWLNELNRSGRKAIIDKDYSHFVNLNIEEETPLKIFLDKEFKQSLQHLLTLLGTNCRNILRMFYYEKKSMKDIAIFLKFKNEDTVKTRKYKCIQTLKEQIKNNLYLRQQLKGYLELTNKSS